MRKIVTAMLAIACLVALPSCNSNGPDFQFKVDLTGDVAVQTAPAISADFQIAATNAADSVAFVCLADCDNALPLEAKAGKDARNYLDDFIEDNFIDKLSNGALYEVKALGYITETTTGLTFRIDKTWTNKPDKGK